MSWSIGYDPRWKRDIGYGVPAICDHPGCTNKIDRGLSFVCGAEPYGGERGCGLYFCHSHQFDPCDQTCERCTHNVDCGSASEEMDLFEPKPDCEEWIQFKLTDESWAQWREENQEEVKALSTYSDSAKEAK